MARGVAGSINEWQGSSASVHNLSTGNVGQNLLLKSKTTNLPPFLEACYKLTHANISCHTLNSSTIMARVGPARQVHAKVYWTQTVLLEPSIMDVEMQTNKSERCRRLGLITNHVLSDIMATSTVTNTGTNFHTTDYKMCTSTAHVVYEIIIMTIM